MCGFIFLLTSQEQEMTSSESVAFFMRFITEKHKQVISSIDQLVDSLVSDTPEEKLNKAKSLLNKSKDLSSSISQQDCPTWLPSLIERLELFISGGHKATHLIKHLMTSNSEIKNFRWVFENKSEAAFDFDSIFEHYKSQSRLPELFDQIIKILEEIRESGEIDSASMMHGLEKVIATLKKSKKGSYFSINGAWAFLISFLKNYMWIELGKLPVLGSAMEALEKTIQEAGDEMEKVHMQVQQEMKNVVETDIKGLTKKSEFSFIGYDKSGTSFISNKSENLIGSV
jgi:hypothetical protein